MSTHDFERQAPRMSWRRRLALAITCVVVAVVVWRFSAVLMKRAAMEALTESGWTVVLEEPPQGSSNLIDSVAQHLGQSGAFLSGMLGREPEVVEVRIFDADGPAADRADLSVLEKLPLLERLYVQRASLSVRDVASIGSVRSLTELTIASDALTDESLAGLAGLTRLRSLTIVSQRVTDEGISHLAGLTSLEFLDLQSTRAGGSGVDAHPRMESLALGPFTGADELESVSRLRGLKQLVLTDSRIGDEGLRRLETLRTLETLHLSGPHTVTDDGLDVLAHLDQLSRLTLHGQHFTFAGMSPLAESSTLEHLELRGRGLDDAGLDQFVPPPSLQSLSLHYTSISEEAFERFVNRYPEIDLWR